MRSLPAALDVLPLRCDCATRYNAGAFQGKRAQLGQPASSDAVLVGVARASADVRSLAAERTQPQRKCNRIARSVSPSGRSVKRALDVRRSCGLACSQRVD